MINVSVIICISFLQVMVVLSVEKSIDSMIVILLIWRFTENIPITISFQLTLSIFKFYDVLFDFVLSFFCQVS